MKKSISKITLTAGVSLALAFTLSACPDKPDDETCNGEKYDSYEFYCVDGELVKIEGDNNSSSYLGSSSSDVKNSSSSNNNNGGSNVSPCPNASTIPVNAEGIGSVTCGGETYKTVKIGEQVWMAKNLNYNAKGSKCYNNSDINCNTYGRLYDWETAKTVCPSSWHLPSHDEWTALIDFVGGTSTAGTKLKSKTDWESYNGIPAGTDEYGFSALPGGSGGYSGSDFNHVGQTGAWWSSTENGSTIAWYSYMTYDYERFTDFLTNKHYFLSVRCLQD